MAAVEPANIEAERSVIGAMLTSPPAVRRVIEEAGLTRDHYYNARHATIHAAIEALHADGGTVDEITVAGALEATGALEQAGGRNFLGELAATVPAPGNAREYAQLVLVKHHQRLAAQVGQEVVELAEAGRLNGALDEAAERLAALAGEARQDASAVRPRLYTIRELDEIPAPDYLVPPFIRERELNVVFGKPGTAKSFFALALSLAVASGTPWLNGARVKPGNVVYIAAEGLSGIRKRVAAWSESTGTPEPDHFHLWPTPVNFFKGETADFEMAVARLERPPILIVVDTMARSMAGGNENLAADVTVFVDNLMRICQRFDAAALVIHHAGKDNRDGRGSNSLEGASAVMVKLELDGTNLRIGSHRDKDAAPFKTWDCHLEAVEDSAVIRPGADLERLADQQADLLATVSDNFGTDWTTTAAIRKASGLSKSTLYRALKALTDGNLLESRKAGSQRREYRLAPDSPTVPDRSNRSDETGQNRPTVSASLEAGRNRLGVPDGGTAETEE